MKFYKKIILLVSLVLIIFSCKKKDKFLIDIKGEELVNFINLANKRKGIERIDSIMQLPLKLSIHKKGVLHHVKGNHFSDLKKYDFADIEYQKALKFYTEEGNKGSIGRAHNRLGVLNTLEGNYSKALIHLNKALQIFREEKDEDNEIVALDSKAHLAFSQKDYKKAITIVEDVLKINIKKKDTSYISSNYTNLGYLAELLNNKELAENYYKEAVTLSRISKKNSTISLTNLGGFYYSVNKLKECEPLYLEALQIASKNENHLLQKEIYEMLVDSIGDKTNSKFLHKYILKKDSINSLIITTKNNNKLKLIEDQYKLIAKNKELEQKKKSQFKNNVIFGVILGFLSILGLFLYQKNKNSKLKLIQDKLILEQKVLRSQMNPHFIFNALTSIQKNLLEEDLLKSSTSLAKFAKLIRQNFEFTSKEFVTLDEDLNALKNYIETQQMRFEGKFDYHINVDTNLDLSYIKIPPMLLQPFIENAIEHGIKPLKEKGTLRLNVFQKGDLTHFEITDNGVGFDQKKKHTKREHALDIFQKRLKLRGLNEEKSFKMEYLNNTKGTKISFALNL